MVESTVTALSFADEEEFVEFEWTFADGVLILDGSEVDPAGLEYVIGYGLKQTLADSWASHLKAKDTTKALASYQKRLEAIIEGAMVAGTRASNPVAVEINRLATIAVETAIKGTSFKDRKGYDEAKGKGAFAKARKAYIVKNSDVLTAQAKLNVEAVKAIGTAEI